MIINNSEQEWVSVFFLEPHYTIYYNENTGVVNITSDSHVKKGNILAQHLNREGYLFTKINNKGVAIHQIIGDKFLGKRKSGYCVNHKDGNKLNNSLRNLEYVTVRENVLHSVRTGLHVCNRPQCSGRYKHGRAVKGRVRKYKHDWYIKNRYGI